jgi:hypothetical protein
MKDDASRIMTSVTRAERGSIVQGAHCLTPKFLMIYEINRI